MECWRTWWSELTCDGRAQWSEIAAGDYLTVEQLRRLQYEGLVMTGQRECVDGELRALVPVELRQLAGHPVAVGA